MSGIGNGSRWWCPREDTWREVASYGHRACCRGFQISLRLLWQKVLNAKGNFSSCLDSFRPQVLQSEFWQALGISRVSLCRRVSVDTVIPISRFLFSIRLNNPCRKSETARMLEVWGNARFRVVRIRGRRKWRDCIRLCCSCDRMAVYVRRPRRPALSTLVDRSVQGSARRLSPVYEGRPAPVGPESRRIVNMACCENSRCHYDDRMWCRPPMTSSQRIGCLERASA